MPSHLPLSASRRAADVSCQISGLSALSTQSRHYRLRSTFERKRTSGALLLRYESFEGSAGRYLREWRTLNQSFKRPFFLHV